MKDAVVLTFWQLLFLGLAPALITGLVGVVAGLLGPWLLEGRKQEAEKKRRRAEKFEELVQVLHEHKHWLDTARGIRVFGSPGEVGEAPIHKATAIMTVYFPEFYSGLTELDAAADRYEIWMLEKGGQRLKGNMQNLGDGFKEAAQPYRKKFYELLSEMREYTKKEFQ